ncbi:class I SAM-dependent methyltransferase [Pontibacter anaerobius]|uniref:Class I SAM-dependent methyltransferase n=1 Tax=Pontibacter anaerobius TaxID=2993940 RepID=A0ABT3RJ69_9BACT|nr:class I SAM-dependent methyltransferase [Pontibacter anaerobius]MCX2741724.1 class I SAM-dependent methyltransferase [Pontibacter anaerobius]
MHLPATAKLYLLLLTLCLSACNSCLAQQQEKKPASSDGYTYKTASRGGIGKVYMGREIAGIISPAGGAWLERESREEQDKASVAIENMGLRPNSVVADIGAGVGYYTFRIAPKMPNGKVYAIDVQDEFVAALKERAAERGLTNVEVVKGGSQSINLPENLLDLAFMVDVYHELEYPKEMLQDIHRALKPDGILLLLEYRAEDPDVQVKELHKMSVEQITKELGANGFELHRQVDMLPRQHFLMFRKAAE